MHVEIAAPLGDFIGAFSEAIDNGHAGFLLAQNSGETRERPDTLSNAAIDGGAASPAGSRPLFPLIEKHS
jgi:hypothetical protein